MAPADSTSCMWKLLANARVVAAPTQTQGATGPQRFRMSNCVVAQRIPNFAGDLFRRIVSVARCRRRHPLGDRCCHRAHHVLPGHVKGVAARQRFNPHTRRSTARITCSAFTSRSCAGCAGKPQVTALAMLITGKCRKFCCGPTADRAPLGRSTCTRAATRCERVNLGVCLV
jgi:hypothetical protein